MGGSPLTAKNVWIELFRQRGNVHDVVVMSMGQRDIVTVFHSLLCQLCVGIGGDPRVIDHGDTAKVQLETGTAQLFDAQISAFF